jgi:ABC-type phosphate transport system auxiliary subunit
MTALLDQITELIDQPMPRERQPHLERVERLLTDGYAQALSLEAERWRLERRIGQVAGDLTTGDLERKTQELSSLTTRLRSTQCDLLDLRNRLASLRDHAAGVRAA